MRQSSLEIETVTGTEASANFTEDIAPEGVMGVANTGGNFKMIRNYAANQHLIATKERLGQIDTGP